MQETNQSIQAEKLRNERQEFLDLAMQRGKLLQDRQREIREMEEKVKEADTKTEIMKQKFEREAEAVSANLRVISLKGEKETAEKTLKELQLEYEAFKKHSNNLLAKEKNLNSQLRNLVS
ncbi:putative coiled-coil domain-containing protein [Apostichopus japonicus]|uniref:Putative coiled-coil domain-containing protein n=1 Tax=Stichopus japonicus TaxID=307972 RepID=A0A2G8KZ13_STIJA|nr:putative coiled-coil domain-containing protein [Apostichopus japonicus]